MKATGSNAGWRVLPLVLHGTALTICMNMTAATELSTNARPVLAVEDSAEAREQIWNWHVQNTVVVQGHPSFSAKYSGPNSLHSNAEVQETVSLDVMAGVRLWRGAQAHVDGLVWQGYGLSKTVGVEGFPNGDTYHFGTKAPNVTFARVLIRQTFGLGSDVEQVEDEPLRLAGEQDSSRLTLTLGKMGVTDIFDNNAYANDPRSQFLNWALTANEAWDYPGDSLGYTTGLAIELEQPQWALRYGFFQMPRTPASTALDAHYLDAWGMVMELEHRHALRGHPGAVRLLGFVNRANMGSYQAALDSPIRPPDIEDTRAYRHKYGFGLNLEQELTKNIGIFSRLGWSDGKNEAWSFSDVDRTASLGVSIKGGRWHRPNDTFGLAGVLNGISRVHQHFFAAGGEGLLAGDGALSYGWEKILETYYDFQIWKTVHAALDYQFISHPAFNRDRGPVSVLGARLHWEF